MCRIGLRLRLPRKTSTDRDGADIAVRVESGYYENRPECLNGHSLEPGTPPASPGFSLCGSLLITRPPRVNDQLSAET